MNYTAFIVGFAVIAALFVFVYLKLFKKPKKLQRIWTQIQAGDTKNSIRHLKTIIYKQGGSVDAHYLLAECYRRERNCQIAVVEYRYCMKIGKKPFLTTDKGIREGLVECLLKLNKDDEALTELLELERIEPRNDEYLIAIAKIFYKKGNLEQSVTYFDRTVKANPANEEALGYLGMIMYHANQIKEAVTYLTKAVKYNPRNYRAYYYLGRLYMDGRDFPRAITYFEASQRSPEYRIRAYLQKGICYRDMDEINNAIEEYKKGIAAATGKDQSLLLATKYMLANLYESRGKLAEAIEQWEGINKIDRGYKDVPKKLEQYQDLRADDNMKDFLVSPLPVYEGICLDIIKHLGYDISDMKHVKSGITTILAMPKPSVMRNVKRQRVYIKVYRDAITLGLTVVKKLLEEAKALRCQKAVCISPLNFRPDAQEFSMTRQIDLIGGDRLSKILNEIKEQV
jgi:tetratricopeptide (TPR) repeat protein